MARKNRVGLSLSICIPEIAEDKVPIEEVAVVLSGARFEFRSDLEKRLEYIVNVYPRWQKNPEGCKAIALHLYDDGRLISVQSRGLPIISIADGYWC